MLNGCLAAGNPAASTHPAPRTSPSSAAESAIAASGDTAGDASGDTSAQAAARPASGKPLNAAMSHCSRLPDLPTPPADALDVTRFGARPDDELPDDEGITRALAALKPGGWLLFPPGRYLQAHSIHITIPHSTL
jgi:polygalacturonase